MPPRSSAFNFNRVFFGLSTERKVMSRLAELTRLTVLLAVPFMFVGCSKDNGGSPTAPGGTGPGSGTATPTLQSVEVVGKTEFVVGESYQFTAVAKFSDGTQRNVTGEASWRDFDSGAVVVNPSGLLQAIKEGKCAVGATFQGMIGVVGVVVMTAPANPNPPGPPPGPGDPGDPNGPGLTLLAEGPGTVPVGDTIQWQAFLQSVSGSRTNVTSDATWASQNPNIASITGPGRILGVAAGTATLTVTHESRTATFQVQVTTGTPPAPTVTGLTIVGTPCSTVGGAAQLQAIAQMSNGTTQNVTSQATWTSGNAAVATVSNVGVVSCTGPGSTQITASFGGHQASVPVNVTANPAPGPGTITVIGPACTTAGTSAQLQAMLNGSQNVTNQVTWASSNPAVGTVSSTGMLNCLSAGQTTITATLSPHAPGTLPVSVATTPQPPPPNQPDLIGLEVRIAANVLSGNGPLNVSFDLKQLLDANPLVDLKVFGLYSDGSKQEVTHLASINCPAVPQGQVQCILDVDRMGTAEVIVLLIRGLLNAQHPINVTYGGYTANVVVELQLPVLQSLGLNNGQPISLKVGNKLPPLQGLFSQGITSDIDAGTPGITYQIQLADGLLTQLAGVPVIGPVLVGALTSQLNQIVGGLSVVDGVLVLAPGLQSVLDSALNNQLFAALGLDHLPLKLTATLNGVTSAPAQLRLTR
jgi:hypothetical protein